MHPAALLTPSDPTTAELIAARPQLHMHAMDGLMLEGVPLNAIADAVGTPTWVMSADTVRTRLRALQHAFAARPVAIHYAMKANDHLAILRIVHQGGAGVDVVSGGEIMRARHADIPGDRIVFAGVGKTPAELALALDHHVGQFNVESAEELAMLSGIASARGQVARVALRINPDVDAGTHAKITTGRADNKFGIAFNDAAALYAIALPGIHMAGISVHIGSQILSMLPFRAAFARVAELVRTLQSKGHTVEIVDCGGGLGVDYQGEAAPLPEALAGAMQHAFAGLDVQLAIEPGRWLVAPAGVLLASVVLVKHAARRFVVLDAAMNDLLRPAMYDSWHGVVPLSATDMQAPHSPADVVGPVCESSDVLARDRALPPLAPGSRVAILDTGAYGSVMSSTYNSRPLAAQVLVEGERWSVIRARQPAESLWASETVPEWLA